MLFELSRPLDDLQQMLLDEFAGQTLTMRELYERHSVGRPFIESNYKKVLIALEVAHEIEAVPPINQRPRRRGETTFADHVRVRFPPKEKP